jgi:hypothetical protein
MKNGDSNLFVTKIRIREKYLSVYLAHWSERFVKCLQLRRYVSVNLIYKLA